MTTRISGVHSGWAGPRGEKWVEEEEDGYVLILSLVSGGEEEK